MAMLSNLDERKTGKFLRALSVAFPKKLSTRLIAGFTAISILAALIGITGLVVLDRINTTLNYITDVAAPTVETSDDLIVLIFKATTLAQEIIANEDVDEIQKLTIPLTDIGRNFEMTYLELQKLVTDESLLDELEVAKTAHAEFRVNKKKMIAAHLGELNNNALAFKLLENFDLAGSKLTEALDEFATENRAEMAKAEEEGDLLELQGASGAAINKVLGLLFDQDYPVVEAALNLQRIIIEVQDTAGEFLAEEKPENLTKIENEFNRLHETARPYIATLKRLAESEEDTQDALNLDAMLESWVALALGPGQLFDIHRRTLGSEAEADRLAHQLELNADLVAAALDKVAETADAINDSADEAADEAVRGATTIIFSLLVLAVILSLALLVLVVKTVVNPIKGLTNTMLSMGERYGPALKFDAAPEDEIGQLRLAFENLRSQVDQRTEQLNDANINLEKELEERQSLENQLVQAQKMDGLGTLAGGIAHDFNNMLYVILGCTELAKADFSENKKISTLISKIDVAAQRSKNIVNQILFFSRHEQPDRHPVLVSSIMEEALTLLRAGLPTTMKLRDNISDACGMVLADETQMQQLIVNLVTNAYQAHVDRRGQIDLEARPIDVGSNLADKHFGLNTGMHVLITVTDQGTGILEKDLNRIFDPFFTTKPVGEGTGLGLAVVHGIVTSHEGTITVYSEPNVGSTFEVYLPAYNKLENYDAENELYQTS